MMNIQAAQQDSKMEQHKVMITPVFQRLIDPKNKKRTIDFVIGRALYFPERDGYVLKMSHQLTPVLRPKLLIKHKNPWDVITDRPLTERYFVRLVYRREKKDENGQVVDYTSHNSDYREMLVRRSAKEPSLLNFDQIPPFPYSANKLSDGQDESYIQLIPALPIGTVTSTIKIVKESEPTNSTDQPN